MGDGSDDLPGVGGGEPQGPVRVADFLPSVHALADFATHSELLSRPHWRYIDVMAWIASRDFGVLNGFRELSDTSGASSAGWSRLTMSSNGSPSIPIDIIHRAFDQLNRALADGELQATGRRDGGDPVPIPPQTWQNGSYQKDRGGIWWEGAPYTSPGWTQITIDRSAVLDRFETREARPELRAPAASEPWVPLTAALMWIHCNHAADIGELMAEPLVMLGQSAEHVRCVLETRWRRMANVASQGHLKIRGRPFDGSTAERDERDLTRDELLNCKWFDWAVGDREAEFTGAVYRGKPDDLDLERSGMHHFAFVRVDREALIRLWPAPADQRSMGAALSLQLVRVDHARVGDLIPLAEAYERVAATVPPVDDWTGSVERLVTAELVAEANIQRLRELLQSRKVPAFVCELDGKHWRIPPGYWGSFHDYAPLAGSGFNTERSHGELAHRLDGLGVHVARADLEAALTAEKDKVVTTAKAVTDLKNWLAAKLDSCSPDTVTRPKIELEAKEKFTVSGNAFDATWKIVTADGRSHWNKGGRKPRRAKGLTT